LSIGWTTAVGHQYTDVEVIARWKMKRTGDLQERTVQVATLQNLLNSVPIVIGRVRCSLALLGLELWGFSCKVGRFERGHP
jgi:hypothetical protein